MFFQHGRNIFDPSTVHKNEQIEANGFPVFPMKKEETNKNFVKQVEIANSAYQIQDHNNNPIEIEGKQEGLSAQQIETSKLNNNSVVDNILNNIGGNVLSQPNKNSKSTTKTNSGGNLAGAQPLFVPTVTPETKKEKDNEQDSNVITSLIKKIRLPEGVVPIREDNLDIKEKVKPDKNEDKNIPDEINLALPNRYRNNILDTEIQNELNKETKVDTRPKLIPQRELPINPQREPELNQDLNQDNNAMEVMDQPKALGQENQNENLNMESNDIKMQENEPKDTADARRRKHIDTLGERQNDGVLRAPAAGGQYEGEGDYDKDGHKEDLQIEEQEPEGEEDGKVVDAKL